MGSHTSSSEIRLILDSFRRIVHVLRLFDIEAQRRLGLSGAQVFVLEKLKEAGGISINELAGRTHTHQSSVSVIVQKLVGLKLVERAASATDGRRVELFLTTKGEGLLASAPRPPKAASFPRSPRCRKPAAVCSASFFSN